MFDSDPIWRRDYALSLLVAVGGFAVLYVVQVRNYLLFHSAVEIFSILVAFAVFIITWNAREELDNSFVVILGVSFLFVGGVDLLHTLAYKGMGVFPAAGVNLPTQLWIFGRYLEAASFLVAGAAVVVEARRGNDWRWGERPILVLIAGYAGVTALGLASIFVFDAFPQAYDPGSGLTDFKVYSEYLIVGLFASGLGFLYDQRETFDRRVFQLLAVSLVLTMGSELAFTTYVDVYGLSNAVGHFLKLASFYLIYLAVVKTGIKEPQRALYRTLARREAEARKFKKAADYSGHAVLITDREGRIQYVNDAWEDMTGYSSSEALGKTPSLLKSGEHDPSFYDELWETILAGDVWEGEIANERKDGERFVIHQTIAPIIGDDGDIRGFAGINDEITDRKEYQHYLESSLQRSVEQLQLLSRVLRHNIRNEMNVIRGNAELVEERASDPDVEAMAARIIRSSDDLLTQAETQREIVQFLLEPTTETTISVSDLVTDVVDRLRDAHPSAEIDVETPPELELRTIPELRQAVEEVVENAIVHTDQEPAEVSVSVRAHERDVEIRIADNGPGIPPVEREVITGDTEADDLLHSSGLGLWFVSHVITAAGGTIRFEDVEPRGTLVTLVVPRGGIAGYRGQAAAVRTLEEVERRRRPADDLDEP